MDFNSHMDAIVAAAVRLVNVVSPGQKQGRDYTVPTGAELTRAVNEAIGRLRRRHPVTDLDQIDLESATSAQIIQFPTLQPQTNPESEMSRQEIREFLELAVDRLPPAFRAVFVLRDVEGLSVEETASFLSITQETVRSRLHRARKLMRAAIAEQLSGAFASLFPFDGERCVHMADRVVLALRDTARLA